METKTELAEKFSGPSSLMYQHQELNIVTGSNGLKSFAITPELDVPCKVDSLNFEQGEADISMYNIYGLTGAWVTDEEPGSMDFGFRVPSICAEIVKLAFGEDAVDEITGAMDDTDYEGLSIVYRNTRVDGTWLIVNNDKDRIMVLNNITLFANLVLDSDAKGVMAIDFNGSIETDGSDPDVIILKQKRPHYVIGYDSYENENGKLTGIGEAKKLVWDGMNVIEMA